MVVRTEGKKGADDIFHFSIFDRTRARASDPEIDVIQHLKADFPPAIAFFNYQPWADITLTAADRFLKKFGYLEGEPTLPASPNGEKLIVQP